MNTSVKQQLEQHKGKIIWIVSYPKSGRTWFRAFLSGLIQGKATIDINNLFTDYNINSRHLFNTATSVNSSLLYQDEITAYWPKLFQYIAKHKNGGRVLFVLIHKKCLPEMLPFINHESTLGALYLIRNPLAITPSFASHLNMSIDHTIACMNDPTFTLNEEHNTLFKNNYFEEHLGSWSDHVLSWVEQIKTPLHLMRYEDSKQDTLLQFSQALQAMQLNIPANIIASAIEKSNFKKLKSQEKEAGFMEKVEGPNQFFRKGKVDSWKSELSKEQQERVMKHHGKVMKRFGYL